MKPYEMNYSKPFQFINGNSVPKGVLYLECHSPFDLSGFGLSEVDRIYLGIQLIFKLSGPCYKAYAAVKIARLTLNFNGLKSELKAKFLKKDRHFSKTV